MILSQLSPGQKARVVHYDGLERPIKKKLMSLGILPNSNLELIRFAPMGDPIQIRTRGMNMAIHKVLAQEIEVEVLPS
jgi:ferrous iron transport protein A